MNRWVGFIAPFVLAAGLAEADAPRKGSPAPVVARVVRLQIIDGGLIVMFNRGTNDGIERTWMAEFLDAGDAPAPDGSCMLIRIDKSTGVCKTALTLEQAKRFHLRLRARS